MTTTTVMAEDLYQQTTQMWQCPVCKHLMDYDELDGATTNVHVPEQGSTIAHWEQETICPGCCADIHYDVDEVQVCDDCGEIVDTKQDHECEQHQQERATDDTDTTSISIV